MPNALLKMTFTDGKLDKTIRRSFICSPQSRSSSISWRLIRKWFDPHPIYFVHFVSRLDGLWSYHKNFSTFFLPPNNGHWSILALGDLFISLSHPVMISTTHLFDRTSKYFETKHFSVCQLRHVVSILFLHQKGKHAMRL